MLNYDLHIHDEPTERDENISQVNPVLKNPFPGLRPFSLDESHLFFGRENQVDDVLSKLAQNRFVTVMGYSGSGKSSLVYCGVIPVVYGGYMTNAGPDWNIITTRPEGSPINNLATSLLSIKKSRVSNSEDLNIERRIISSILRSNAKGLVEALTKIYASTGQNILIFIDQFEELFRFAQNSQDSAEEARLYVNLILDACRNTEIPIYVAITMRSDYVGECAKFPGLTQLLNESNYLVPQMSRDQKRMAIAGPISVGGGVISKRLLKRLLNEIGDNQDQLPILQHALMRTWDFWINNREENEPIDIGHYNAIGKITEALSQHANETYDELTSREKEISEILFKLLTEKTSNNFGMRRPARLNLVAELAEASEAEVIAVVNKFRETGRSFLMPPDGVELHSDSIIEISHESLMRIWTRLKVWVDEEHESAQMYRRLSEAAAMYQIGRTGLWRPPDLQLALNWQKKQKPTRSWAKRYDEAFERAVVFLDTSRITYEAEQKNQEMLQKRLLKRARGVALGFGIAAVISILFFVYAITQSIEAKKQAEEANNQRAVAEVQKLEAEKQQQIAEEQTGIAVKALEEAEIQRKKALVALAQAEYEKQRAEENVIIAEQQRGIASEERQVAYAQRNVAEKATIEAKTNFDLANKLLYQSVAQSMAVKSLGIEDDNLKGLLSQQAKVFYDQYDGRKYDLKGLLSQQAKVFYDQYDGRKYDSYIYNGLYSALAQIRGRDYNTVNNIHRNSVRSVVFNKQGTKFYSTGTQGNIVSTSFSNQKEHTTVLNNPFPNRVLDISSNDKWLINANDSSFIQIYNFEKASYNKITGHTGYVNDVKFLPNQEKFISAGSDLTVRINDVNTLSNEIIIKTDSEIKTLDISPDGKYIAGGTIDGQLILIDILKKSQSILFKNANDPIHSVSFSPNGNLLASGDERGIVRLYNLNEKRIVKELSGQKGRISSVAFSANGKLMAAGSLDKTIQMWVMDELDELPIRMTDNDAYVWDIVFSPDSNYIVSGCADGDIRFWPTTPDLISDEMCKELNRNMDEEEWKTYVGNDIPHRNTCINLLLNDY